MKIYKFKSFIEDSDFCHFLQIVNENKIWCASIDSLNDPDEFKFELDYDQTDKTKGLLTKVLSNHGTSQYPLPAQLAAQVIKERQLEKYVKPVIKTIIENSRHKLRVTSFSKIGTGEKLSEKYGGSGNGAVVEIEIPDKSVGDEYHIVDYKSKKIIHVDLLLDSLGESKYEFFKSMLCTKTDIWKDEQEIRFLGKCPKVTFIPVNTVKTITIGNKVLDCHKDKILKCCKEKGILVNYN